MLWDTHMHTAFSGDCDIDPELMINAACNKGLGGICITDHCDIDYPDCPGLEPDAFLLDLESYYPTIRGLCEKYSNTFDVRCGVELGLQPHLKDKHEEIVNKYAFDFVIGSSHVCHRKDPYYSGFYEGREEEECYREYFESILENIKMWDGFDVYGHIDYVVRYGPNKNQYYSYEKYADVIDPILKELISRGKGIEINTGGFKYELGHPNPTEGIIKRYRELGGEIITIGADAHKPENIAYDFEKVPGILKECGFEYFTVFKGRKPEFVKLS